jgi:hypothetical protein
MDLFGTVVQVHGPTVHLTLKNIISSALVFAHLILEEGHFRPFAN